MMLLSALLLAAQAQAPEWAPVAILDSEGTTIYFVDRSGIKVTPGGRSARVYLVTKEDSAKLHFEYDCDGQRYRAVDASLGSAAAEWAPIKPQSPLHVTMRYVCSGGKIDLGFGDMAIKTEMVEPFAREVMSRRSALKK